MRLVIDIDLGNAAMRSASDAANAMHRSLLQQASDLFSPLETGEYGTISDRNGNTVGTWEVRP